MKKRLIALLLAVSCLAGALSGCGGKTEQKEPFSQGELLTMICDAFGMYSFTEETPYLASVPAGDPYFDAVQMCVEWDIIPAEEQDYDVNADVTRGALALALVNAAVLTDLEATDEEKMDVAAEKRIVQTEKNGTIKEKKTVDRVEAQMAVDYAAKLWIEREYTENIQEVTYQEDVRDVTQAEVRQQDGVVYVPVSAGTIRPGDAFVYAGPTGLTAAKAASVTEADGYYAIVESDEDFDLEDITQDIFVQETYTPDLTAAVFTDGAGNVYIPREVGGSAGASGTSAGEQTGGARFLGAGIGGARLRQTGLGSGSIDFKIGDVTITGKIESNSVSVGVKFPTEKDDKDNEIEGINANLTFSDIKLTNDIDYKVLSGLKSLTTKVDYKVKLSGGASVKWKDKVLAPYNNGNGGFLTNLARSSWKNISAAGADSITTNKKSPEIKIGSWTLVQGGLAQVKLELKLKFTVTGEMTASLEVAGAKGVEYRNGNLRVIKEVSKDTDLQFKCKSEGTAGPGIALKILNKWDVVEVSANLGIGAEASATLHLVDDERHMIDTYNGDDLSLEGVEYNRSIELRASPNAILVAAIAQGVEKVGLPSADVTLTMDTCIELQARWILRIQVKPAEFLKKINKKLGATISVDILEKDKAQIFKYHVDNFDFFHPVSECTLKYTPFEYLNDGTDTGVGAQNAEKLDLTAYLLIMNGTDPQQLELVADKDGNVPEVTWSSEDETVAKVDSEGNVTPVSVGTTLITAALKSDPNIYVKCAVYVQTVNDNDWEFLPADMPRIV